MNLSSQQQRRILVVDDEPAIRQGIKHQLHRIRTTIPTILLEAGDAVEAREFLDAEHVDCMLLDHQLPGLNGMTFLKEMVDAYPDTPVIMITGHGDEELAVQAMKAGASDYLVKGSIAPQGLIRSIVNALEKKELREQLEKQNEELIAAERQRVMIESLGAACHHIGQPVTVILLCLDMLREASLSKEDQETLNKAYDSVEKVQSILMRMRETSEYRTVPYKALSEKPLRILDLGEGH